jgi:hypothetical protein
MKIKQIDPRRLLEQHERTHNLEEALQESLKLTLKENPNLLELLPKFMNEELSFFIVSNRQRCLQYMRIIDPKTPKNFSNLIAKIKLQFQITRHYLLSYFEIKKLLNDQLYNAG